MKETYVLPSLGALWIHRFADIMIHYAHHTDLIKERTLLVAQHHLLVPFSGFETGAISMNKSGSRLALDVWESKDPKSSDKPICEFVLFCKEKSSFFFPTNINDLITSFRSSAGKAAAEIFSALVSEVQGFDFEKIPLPLTPENVTESIRCLSRGSAYTEIKIDCGLRLFEALYPQVKNISSNMSIAS